MRGREGKVPAAADLLVCFPSRAHLSLMPKPIRSPARPSEPPTRHRQRRKSGSRIGAAIGNGHGSGPLMWTKSKADKSDISEPTSPKVTCAGQIKVRAKPTSCKNWQSVMEEIERIHNNRKQKRRSTWIESLGFKKDVMQFLTCLRNLRFDFRCFGGFPSSGITSDDEDEDEYDVEDRRLKEEDDCNSNDVFSKWYMILQENQGREFADYKDDDENDKGDPAPSAPPPPNALLLTRCRSAPAQKWPEVQKDEQKEERAEDKHETAAVKCREDFSIFSEEIAKETWIVGGIKDMLSRNRSWKR